MTENLSDHFTLQELTYSDTAVKYKLSNVPCELHKKTLKHTCQYLLEPLRTLLNSKYKTYVGKKVKCASIKITSGYRGPVVNAKVGGVSTSQHCTGEAADIEAVLVFTDGTRKVLPYTELYSDIRMWVKGDKLSIDQCIQECAGGAKWVHVSHSASGKTRDRKQFLKYDGRKYTPDK